MRGRDSWKLCEIRTNEDNDTSGQEHLGLEPLVGGTLTIYVKSWGLRRMASENFLFMLLTVLAAMTLGLGRGLG